MSWRRARPQIARVPQLPAASGKPQRTLSGGVAWVTPRRRPTPTVVVDARTRALRLRGPRPLRLRRPELHHGHDHQAIAFALARALAYVEAGGELGLASPAPLARWVLGYELDRIEAKTPAHHWHHLWRLNDVRAELDLAPHPLGAGGAVEFLRSQASADHRGA